jgi:hypothetical protein
MSFSLILLFIGYKITEKLFQVFWDILKPTNSNNKNKDTAHSSNNAGNIGTSQFLIQCGGYGNL